MSVTVLSVPSAKLNPVQNCLILAFSSDSLAENTGSSASLEVDQSVFTKLQVGSIVRLNGITINVTGNTDLATNQISPGGNAANLCAIIFSQAYEGTRNYAINNGGAFQVSGKNCQVALEMTFQNLSDNTGQILKYVSAPDTFRVKPNYSVLVGLFPFGQGYSTEPLAELRIFPKVSLNNSLCNIDEVEIKKDISSELQGIVYTPFPTFGTSYINSADSMTQRVHGMYAESYGIPQNNFTNRTLPRFKIFSGGHPAGDDGLTNYTGENGLQEIMTVFQDGDTITCNQPLPLYYFVEDGGGVTLQVSWYNKSGTLMSADTIQSSSITSDIGQINATIADIIQSGNVDGRIPENLDDVATYEIVINDSEPLRFNVKCEDCNSYFIFLTPLGYASITSDCFNNIDLEIIKETAELCNPCTSDVTTITTIKGKKLFEVFIRGSDYGDAVVDALFMSKKVYWYDQTSGISYQVNPENDSANIHQRDKDVDIQFKFSMTI